MPGGPVLTGGPEELLPAAEFTSSSRGSPSICVCSLGPGEDGLGTCRSSTRSGDPGDEEASEDALQLVEKRARRQSEQSRRQGMEKETWKIMRSRA